MLFKSSITKDIIRDEDKLVEQFYIFLNEFVRYKLRYESIEVREDCIQETILVLLKRAKSLTDKEIEELNLEQYFYNRANSYISSIFLGKLNRYRSRVVSVDSYSEKSLNPYITNTSDHWLSLNVNHIEYENYIVDTVLLQAIINEYDLPQEEAIKILTMSLGLLEDIGFTIEDTEIIYDKDLYPLVISIADDYVLQTLKGA